MKNPSTKMAVQLYGFFSQNADDARTCYRAAWATAHRVLSNLPEGCAIHGKAERDDGLHPRAWRVGIEFGFADASLAADVARKLEAEFTRNGLDWFTDHRSLCV